MATFRSTQFPALAFYIDDRLVKFAGGVLEVNDEQAEVVQSLMAASPQYGITQDGADEADPETDEPSAAEQMQEALDEAYDLGILEEEADADELMSEGVSAARIDETDEGDLVLVQTVDSE